MNEDLKDIGWIVCLKLCKKKKKELLVLKFVRALKH